MADIFSDQEFNRLVLDEAEFQARSAGWSSHGDGNPGSGEAYFVFHTPIERCPMNLYEMAERLPEPSPNEAITVGYGTDHKEIEVRYDGLTSGSLTRLADCLARISLPLGFD